MAFNATLNNISVILW